MIDARELPEFIDLLFYPSMAIQNNAGSIVTFAVVAAAASAAKPRSCLNITETLCQTSCQFQTHSYFVTDTFLYQFQLKNYHSSTKYINSSPSGNGVKDKALAC